VAEVVRRSRDKKRIWNPIFMLSPKPIARFRWKRARLSLLRPQPYLSSYIQIHPSFRDLLAKTTFQIVTITGGSLIITNHKLIKEIHFQISTSSYGHGLVHCSCSLHFTQPSPDTDGSLLFNFFSFVKFHHCIVY